MCCECGRELTERPMTIEGATDIDTGYTVVGRAEKVHYIGKYSVCA